MEAKESPTAPKRLKKAYTKRVETRVPKKHHFRGTTPSSTHTYIHTYILAKEEAENEKQLGGYHARASRWESQKVINF